MPLNPRQSYAPVRDPALDGLRGLAVLLVFAFHYGGGLHAGNFVVHLFGYLSQAGWAGVQLFFALSGLLITGILFDSLGHRHALRNFFVRRALRIAPLYYFALLLAAFAALWSGFGAARLAPLWVYAGFLQNVPALVPIAGSVPPPLPLFHLWSLAVEVQFYLLWAFLLPVSSARRALNFCLVVAGLSFLFRLAVYAPHGAAHTGVTALAATLPVRIGALALGGALAMWRRQTPAPGLGVWPLRIAVACIVLIVGLGFYRHSFLLDGRLGFIVLLPLVDVLCVALVALALEPGRVDALVSTLPLPFLGRISYGFYVFHLLLQPVFDHLGAALSHAHGGAKYQAIRLLVALPLTTLAAWVSFVCLERPFLRMKCGFPRKDALG